MARLRAEVEGGARAAERAAAEGGELRASLEAAKAAAAAEAAARAARSEWRLGGAMVPWLAATGSSDGIGRLEAAQTDLLRCV